MIERINQGMRDIQFVIQMEINNKCGKLCDPLQEIELPISY